MEANRFGLSRNIPERVKREVRRRCGFGCVYCGLAIIDYDHFSPEFADAERHDAEGITLLCPTHHRMATTGEITRDEVAAADSNPRCRRAGFAQLRDLLFLARPLREVVLGGSEVHAEQILMYDEEILFGFALPECRDAPLRLTLLLTDHTGQEVLKVVDNEMRLSTTSFDIQKTGTRLIVRSENDVVLNLAMGGDLGIRIDTLNMLYKGFRLKTTRNDAFQVTTPWGAVFRNKGQLRAEYGYRMSADSFTVASGPNGGGAIRFGRSADNSAP